jgi:hypothetical protein
MTLPVVTYAVALLMPLITVLALGWLASSIATLERERDELIARVWKGG